MYENRIEVFGGLPVAEFDPAIGIVEPGVHALRLQHSSGGALSRRWQGEEVRRLKFIGRVALAMVGVLIWCSGVLGYWGIVVSVLLVAAALVGWGSDYLDVPDVIDRLAADPDAAFVEVLVIGVWSQLTPPQQVVERLCKHAESFPALRAIYFGDVGKMPLPEEEVVDLGPLLKAFPLQQLGARGDDGLRIRHPRSETLTRLVIDGEGIDAQLVRDIGHGQLPNVQDLQVRFGDGSNEALSDVRRLADPETFPMLTRLAVRDCAHADAIARLLAERPMWLTRLEHLELTSRTLSDASVRGLLDVDGIEDLEQLTIRSELLSGDVVEELLAMAPQVAVTLTLPEPGPPIDEPGELRLTDSETSP